MNAPSPYIILVSIAIAAAVLNLWFLFESYQLYRLEKKQPLSPIESGRLAANQSAREFHPVYGSIYKVYAAMKPTNDSHTFELHVVAETSDSPRLLKHVGANDVSHILTAGSIYAISYFGSDVKDACTDFLKDRCEIMPTADIIVNVYTLKHLATVAAPSSDAPPIVNPDFIEHHLWGLKTM